MKSEEEKESEEVEEKKRVEEGEEEEEKHHKKTEEEEEEEFKKSVEEETEEKVKDSSEKESVKSEEETEKDEESDKEEKPQTETEPQKDEQQKDEQQKDDEPKEDIESLKKMLEEDKETPNETRSDYHPAIPSHTSKDDESGDMASTSLSGVPFTVQSVGVTSLTLRVNTTGMLRVWCRALKEYTPLRENVLETTQAHEVKDDESKCV